MTPYQVQALSTAANDIRHAVGRLRQAAKGLGAVADDWKQTRDGLVQTAAELETAAGSIETVALAARSLS